MGTHKKNTMSFRVTDYQREEIESRIKASGMFKQDYIVRSCIYNKVCVVGKKEVIYSLVEELRIFSTDIGLMLKQLEEQELNIANVGIEEFNADCINLLKAIIWLLEGAEYLWKD